MLAPKFGMGPVIWQGGKLDRCEDLHVDHCDPSFTDLCCVVIPCTYCLKWAVYGELDKTGSAAYDRRTGEWLGTVNDMTFRAYWQNRYGVCYFIVVWGGDEVAALSCYDGAKCSDSSASVDLTLSGYTSGTLSWTKQESKKLPYRKDSAGCVTWFCGNCECTCKELCAILKMTTTGPGQFLEGEHDIKDGSYSVCDGPKWTGSVPTTFGSLTENVEVYIYMYRDEYTDACYLAGHVRGQDLEPYKVLDCNAIDHTFTLYDGSIVRIKCKECGCGTTNYCEFCCLPMDYSIPEYPAGVLKSIPFSITGCGGGSGTFAATPGNEPCQTEVVFSTDRYFNSTQFSRYQFDLPNASGCPKTPCTNPITFRLECTARYAQPGDDKQCDRLWLWIGSLIKQTGDTGEVPGGPLIAGFSWKRVPVGSCACDPVGGISAAIPFSITADCYGNGTIGVNGACAGLVIDCCDGTCSGTLFV